jgi:hypothetical protein
MPLPRVTAALTTGALSLVLAVHAAAAPSVSTAGGPALGITVAGAGAACSVRAGGPVAECSGVDLFAGARLAPGSSHTTVVVARNAGRSALRGLDLVPGACTSPDRPARARSLCSAIRLRVTTIGSDGHSATPVEDVPLGALSRSPVRLAPLPASGQRETVRLTITLDRRAQPDLLGTSVALPLSWHVSS